MGDGIGGTFNERDERREVSWCKDDLREQMITTAGKPVLARQTTSGEGFSIRVKLIYDHVNDFGE